MKGAFDGVFDVLSVERLSLMEADAGTEAELPVVGVEVFPGFGQQRDNGHVRGDVGQGFEDIGQDGEGGGFEGEVGIHGAGFGALADAEDVVPGIIRGRRIGGGAGRKGGEEEDGGEEPDRRRREAWRHLQNLGGSGMIGATGEFI
jgi:hypothetical protein